MHADVAKSCRPGSTAVEDPALWGAWRYEDNEATYLLRVAPRDGTEGKSLDVRLDIEAKKDKGMAWYAFAGHVTELANRVRYLSLRLVDASMLTEIDKQYPERRSYPYSFVWYQQQHRRSRGGR
jgi:hypothetical protein